MQFDPNRGKILYMLLTLTTFFLFIQAVKISKSFERGIEQPSSLERVLQSGFKNSKD